MAIATPQALNNTDRLAIRPLLVGRITSVVANYALYILGGGADANPNAANMKGWARNAIGSTGSVADQVSWYVLNNASFLNGGTSIEDAELQGVVEAAINVHFISPLT